MKKYVLKLCILGLLVLLAIPSVGVIMIKLPEKTAQREIQDVDAYAASMEEMKIPTEASVVGIGEATHGNREFQMLKLVVLQKLVTQGNCRAIAFEMPAADAAKLNESTKENGPSVKETVKSMSYALYSTEEMAELTQWIKEYNQGKMEQEHIHIYGIDMQNANGNASYVARFLENGYFELLEDDDVARLKTICAWDDETEDGVKAEDRGLFTRIENMLEKELMSGKESEQLRQVLYCTKVILQIFDAPSFDTDPDDYSDYRDQCMVTNLETARQLEMEKGFSQILLTGHNGHLMKGEAVSYGSITLGERINQVYGEYYFVIGTDFFNAEVNIHTEGTFGEDYERANHFFCSADPLAAQAKRMQDGIYYLDFSKVTDQKSKTYALLHETTDTGLVGEGYSEMMMISMSYRSRIVQAERYDGMIYVYEATPIEPWL